MKIVLIKLSGKIIEELEGNYSLVEIISYFTKRNKKVIVVHGGGKQITQWATKLGIESNFLNGQRVTSEKMIEVVAAVQAGLLNKRIVSALIKNNISAIGVSGVDGNSFRAEIDNAALGFVGKPVRTGSLDWLGKILFDGFVPVFSSICMNKSGNLINVNADYFVKELAKEFAVDEVYYFSDISGILIDGKTKSRLNAKEIEFWINNGEITDGMIPKVNSALSLTYCGVHKIWIGNNFNLFNNGGGTEIVAD